MLISYDTTGPDTLDCVNALPRLIRLAAVVRSVNLDTVQAGEPEYDLLEDITYVRLFE